LEIIPRNSIEREIKIRTARRDFWKFAQTLAPKFYKDTRPHLKCLCETLQSFYRGELLKDDGTPYENLMCNMGPRLGKSRTLILFDSWVFGQNIEERIISASYNDLLASEFSRFCRDTISEEKTLPSQIVYSDIFPNVRIQKGNASVEKFALEGQFFSFLSAGIGGSVTGRGGSIIQIDDPIKNAEESNSELFQDKVWNWYSGTLLSRAEEGCKKIINMTRWNRKDLCGRILDSDDSENWYVLTMPAYDEETDSLLCEELLSRKRYERLRATMDSLIFQANYNGNVINAEGRLYPSFKTYKILPKGETISYTDSADCGSNFCTTFAGIPFQGELFIKDFYASKKAMEITEPETAKFLYDNEVNWAKFESNNGGKGFSRNIERILWGKFKTKKVSISWFHQSANKEARILTASSYVCNHVYWPENWANRWPELFQHLTGYQRDKKSKYDDFEDCLTGLVEMIGIKKYYNIDHNVLNSGQQTSFWTSDNSESYFGYSNDKF
jgi:predicted phage terminase large subunit-like protein